MGKKGGGGVRRTVGVNADGGGECGEEFYVDDDAGDGCGDGAGSMLAFMESLIGVRETLTQLLEE